MGRCRYELAFKLVGDHHPAGKPCIAGIDPGDLEGHVGKLGRDIGDQKEDVTAGICVCRDHSPAVKV